MARILIAEDEEALRSFIARALIQDGHTVTTANDGAEALDVLTRERGAFELLLTDIRMPVMDGIALALAAARDHPAVTIMLMTGFADQRAWARRADPRCDRQAVLARHDPFGGQWRAHRGRRAGELD